MPVPQQVVSVSKEEARWRTEAYNGVKSIGIVCGENYLVKVCKADPAWQLEVGPALMMCSTNFANSESTPEPSSICWVDRAITWVRTPNLSRCCGMH